jgi:hypothetical protein
MSLLIKHQATDKFLNCDKKAGENASSTYRALLKGYLPCCEAVFARNRVAESQPLFCVHYTPGAESQSEKLARQRATIEQTFLVHKARTSGRSFFWRSIFFTPLDSPVRREKGGTAIAHARPFRPLEEARASTSTRSNLRVFDGVQ